MKDRVEQRINGKASEGQIIHGQTITKWMSRYPLLDPIMKTKEVFWINPRHVSKQTREVLQRLPMGEKDVEDAEERLRRFAPFIAQAFPETLPCNGLIESPVIRIPKMQDFLEETYRLKIGGHVLLKEDNLLPIAGSIKARGGIYEVLKHSEELAISHGLLTVNDDYSVFNTPHMREFFSQFSIAVGSTGNLGLSIGIIGAALGYQVTVHMSADAKLWKKELLRSHGVQVIEYPSDYSQAVAEGRKAMLGNPKGYFVDDENSQDLFLGYAVAAKRLKSQFDMMGIIVDSDHPLFVYLPCGVGGGPGGITFGLKLIFGDHVHCFFAEPTHAPCMLLGLMTGLYDRVAVQDFGIDNRTEADGLAVGRPSRFVGKMMKNLLSGVFTVEDDLLYLLLRALHEFENVSSEPSALAGMIGPVRILQTPAGESYLLKKNLSGKMEYATHLVWATGGSLVPQEMKAHYWHKGERIMEEHGLLRKKGRLQSE